MAPHHASSQYNQPHCHIRAGGWSIARRFLPANCEDEVSRLGPATLALNGRFPANAGYGYIDRFVKRRKTSPARKPAPAHHLPPASKAAIYPRGSRHWVFRGLALLFPIGLIAVIECGLRISGLGYEPHFFLRQSVNGEQTLYDNPRFGWRFFPRSMARTPRPLAVPLRKSDSTVRVVVLGESAAMGDPEPAFGMPRLLEVLLSSRFPDKRFEVINAAMTAINSNVILPIAEDCTTIHADAWVIYMGNNEVVGPFGAGTVFGAQVAPLPVIRARVRLGSSRIGELASVVGGHFTKKKETAGESWGGMEMFLASQLRRNDPRMARVYQHFERNLDSIVATGRDAGAKILLCTVGVNLSDCAPFASSHPLDLQKDALSSWEKEYRSGTESQGAGRALDALTHFNEALKLDADYAELHFRIGQCLRSVGSNEAARISFATARDLDTLRFRADSRINDIIRRIGKSSSSTDLKLVDVENELGVPVTGGTASSDQFVDHVHLTFTGNYLLAKRIATGLALQLQLTASHPTDDWLAQNECAQKLGWQDWSERQVLEDLQKRFQRPPFSGQLGHEESMRKLGLRVDQLRQPPRKTTIAKAIQGFRTALTGRPDDWVLHEKLGQIYREAGDYRNAVAQWDAVIKVQPRSAGVLNNEGTAFNALGSPGEAEIRFQRALAIDDGMVEAMNGLGLVWAAQKRFPEALAELQHALEIRPMYPATHVNLALVLEASGKPEQAQARYSAGLQYFPSNAIIHANFARLLAAQGKPEAALEQLRESVRLAPGNSGAHYNLGNVLYSQKAKSEAALEFATAARLDPDSTMARINLAICLMEIGRTGEAIAPLTEAIAIDPNFARTHLLMGLVLEQQQDLRGAANFFRETLRLDSRNEMARKHLQGIDPSTN